MAALGRPSEGEGVALGRPKDGEGNLESETAEGTLPMCSLFIAEEKMEQTQFLASLTRYKCGHMCGIYHVML